MKIMQIEWRYKFVKIVALLVLGLLAATVLLQSRLVTAEINSPDSPAVWGQEERVSTTSATGAFVPVIDRAPDGTVMVVYRHLTGGGYILPYYVKSTNNGGSWTSPAPVRSGTTELPQVTFAFDNNSVAHAVWRTGTDIVHSAQGNWPAAGNPIVSTVEIVQDPDIDIGDNGTLDVVWAQGASLASLNIYHAYSTNGGVGWVVSPPLATNTSKSTSPAVTVDSLGNVHVVWEERVFSISQGTFITEIRYKKGTWSGNTLTFDTNPTTISNPDVNSNRPEIVASDNGKVHVSYMELVSDDEQYPMYVQYNGSSWLPPLDTSYTDPVGVNQSDPFFLISTIDACDNVVYIYYHGALSPTANEQILGANSADNWAYREEVTATGTRSINPSVVCNGSQLFLAFERIEDSGPTAGTSQVYVITATGGKLFLPIVRRP